MTAFLASLLGSRLGRKIAGGLLVMAAFAALLLRMFIGGRQAERLKQQQRSLKNLRERVKTDDEIGRLSPADRRRRLRDWSR